MTHQHERMRASLRRTATRSLTAGVAVTALLLAGLSAGLGASVGADVTFDPGSPLEPASSSLDGPVSPPATTLSALGAVAPSTSPLDVAVGPAVPSDPGAWSSEQFVDETVVGGLTQPVSGDWLPDGRLLVLGKTGSVYVVDPIAGRATLLFEIADVEAQGEHGAMDLLVAPDFSTSSAFYVYYSTAPTGRLRIARYVFTGNGPLDLASGVTIWSNPGPSPLSFGQYHIGGSLNIGPDGKFYVSVGDATGTTNAQDLSNIFGKVLRLNIDGTTPLDNPFYDGAGSHADEIWAYGLRNPFRASFDAASGRYFIGDVGGNNAPTAYEELNLGHAGANYGWSGCEGPLSWPKNGADCSPGVTAPILTYAHDAAVGCCENASITAGEVFHSPSWPRALDGAFIYGDFARQALNWASLAPDGSVSGHGLLKAVPTKAPVWISQGPDGQLYYVHFSYPGSTGELRRLRADAGNGPVLGPLRVTPAPGDVPFSFEFSASATASGQEPLSYRWEFGDGTSTTAATAPATHVYRRAGVYNARLQVTAGSRTVTSDALVVQVGVPPAVSIVPPASGTRFSVGDVLTLQADATDDAPLPDDARSWDVVLVHAAHAHPVRQAAGPSITVDPGAVEHAFASDTFFRVTLTVRDRDGLSSSASIDLLPRIVRTSLRTNLPGPATVEVGGIRQQFPFVLESIVGSLTPISAPAALCIGADAWSWAAWSNGLPASFVLTAHDVDAELVATYHDDGPSAGCGAAGSLRVSLAADRSGSVPLQGAQLPGQGAAYVFVEPGQPLAAVSFWIDPEAGLTAPAPGHREFLAPFDLAGGAVATANPTALGGLGAGAHRVRAEVVTAAGRTESFEAAFTVGP